MGMGSGDPPFSPGRREIVCEENSYFAYTAGGMSQYRKTREGCINTDGVAIQGMNLEGDEN